MNRRVITEECLGILMFLILYVYVMYLPVVLTVLYIIQRVVK